MGMNRPQAGRIIRRRRADGARTSLEAGRCLVIHRLTFAALLIAAAATLVPTARASADTRCSSPYVWGHQSYFGDRFVYSHRHAYPRHFYRSSQHFIYYRRVPHFYSSTYTHAHTSNYYISPEYRAYYTYGPYFEPSRYHSDQRYRSPDTRPYTPYCEPNKPAPSEYETDEQGKSEARAPDAQPSPQRRRHDAHRRLIASEAAELIDRGWKLLDESNSADAMAVFAKAAMLRSDDVEPRIGYALSATLEQLDLIAAWAFQRGVLTDADALADIELTDSVVAALEKELARVRGAEDLADDDARRDAAVIIATLGILLDDREAMDDGLTRLAALERSQIMQTLLKSSKATAEAREADAEPATVAAAE